MANRILVIDDDKDMLEILGHILRHEGYDVIVSGKGELIHRLQDYEPQLVIIDMHLDDQQSSGLDLCRHIKHRMKRTDLPVILISYDLSVGSFASLCGADHFLEKPFSIKDVVRLVHRLLPGAGD